MPTLQIDLNCMTLFVPDPLRPGLNEGTMHVLMPHTDAHDPHHAHVVMLYHMNEQGEHVATRLEGWLLEVGDKNQPSAALALPNENGGRVVDLTELTADHANPGRRVPRELVDGHHSDVVSRVSFYAGGFRSLEAQWPDWLLNEECISMAHVVTWEVEVEEGDVRWSRLDGSTEGSASPPSLRNIKPVIVDGRRVYRLDLHHVAAHALPDNAHPPLSTALDAEQIQSHFRMFYKLLRVEPDGHQLPRHCLRNRKLLDLPEYRLADSWACKVAQAQVE